MSLGAVGLNSILWNSMFTLVHMPVKRACVSFHIHTHSREELNLDRKLIFLSLWP